jgi:hypothetical protein
LGLSLWAASFPPSDDYELGLVNGWFLFLFWAWLIKQKREALEEIAFGDWKYARFRRREIDTLAVAIGS